MGDIEGRRVLDVGCGEGSLALRLSELGAVVTAVDPHNEMLTKARSRARAEQRTIELILARGERLPFVTASFDVVLAKTVLCFVDQAQAMVDEMARVLRPGGRFVIGELHRWSSWAAQRRIRAWFGSALWRHGRFRTAAELRGLAQDAGLDVETVRGAVYYPRFPAAARLMAPYDARISRLTTFGAAFLALAATKPAVFIQATSDMAGATILKN